MPPPFRALLLAFALAFPGWAQAERILVVGDSLTKEYEVEFPALYPNNRASWWSRNWIEILHQRRTDHFNIGDFSQFFAGDPRLIGHDNNWAFPGATSTMIRTRLASTSWADYYWQREFKEQVRNDVARVVVFAGGNDLDSIYPRIYNGEAAAPLTAVIADNLKWIVNHIRSLNPYLQVVLVSVPHIGIAPLVQSESPPDPVKTGRVTAALDALNADLAAYAQAQGIGFAPGVYQFTKAMLDQPFRIGGIEFYKVADADARPRYVFSGDGFHPGTAAQAKIAQIIVATFQQYYPTTPFVPLGDQEIITSILGMDPNIPYQEWAASNTLPAGRDGLLDDADGDGILNLVEFALLPPAPGTSPGQTLTGMQVISNVPHVTWTYKPNPPAQEWAQVVPQYTSNLTDWLPVPTQWLFPQPDGSITARVPATGRVFFRVKTTR